jgi:cysteine desulfurase/selenocysteine lyase
MSTSISKAGPFSVDQVRKDFPIFETGVIYLDSANTSQRPRQVLAAMDDYFTKFNANIHRGAYRISEEATQHYEATRTKVKRLINAASAKEIVYTRGTTEAINLVAYGWGRKFIRSGDLILLTILEHHSNIVPWQILAAATGARIEWVDIDARGRLRMDQFHALLEKQPKLVAFGQISNAMGTINPFAEMTAAAKAAGSTVLIDGAQGAPHLGIDVQAVGPDFYAFSGHKMLGPIGQVIGLGAAVDYLQGFGMETVAGHEREITEYAYEALSEVPGLTVYGPPPSERAGVISFNLDGVHPHDLATIVDRRDVCIRAGHHCAQPLMTRLDVAATARASFYIYTKREEIDVLVDAIGDARRIFAGGGG